MNQYNLLLEYKLVNLVLCCRGFQSVGHDPLLGRRVGQGGSHKATCQQLNDTHTVPKAGPYTKINYEL